MLLGSVIWSNFIHQTCRFSFQIVAKCLMSLLCFAYPSFLFIHYLNSDFSLLKKCVISNSYISYLPLAHIYERTNQIISVYYGVAIGFYQGVSDSTKDFSFLLIIFVCLRALKSLVIELELELDVVH